MVTHVFSKVYYNCFQEKTITAMTIFLITFLQNDHDKFRKFAVTWQKNLVVKTILLYNKYHLLVPVTPA